MRVHSRRVVPALEEDMVGWSVGRLDAGGGCCGVEKVRVPSLW